MSAAGTWRIEVAGRKFILVLKAAGGGKLTGTMVEEGGKEPQPIKNGWENGVKVHWEVTVPFDTAFDGELFDSDNKMRGTAEAPLGSAPFGGTRI